LLSPDKTVRHLAIILEDRHLARDIPRSDLRRAAILSALVGAPLGLLVNPVHWVALGFLPGGPLFYLNFAVTTIVVTRIALPVATLCARIGLLGHLPCFLAGAVFGWLGGWIGATVFGVFDLLLPFRFSALSELFRLDTLTSGAKFADAGMAFGIVNATLFRVFLVRRHPAAFGFDAAPGLRSHIRPFGLMMLLVLAFAAAQILYDR
jgi:hypothetical protein